ncbi:MAG: hypothetical protein QGF53_13245 [Alphaproteobacteria bacterium]|nr:hypothetical protein [Alphaproteobacteria bacterium]
MVGAGRGHICIKIERIGAGAEADQGILNRIRAPAQNGAIMAHLLDIGAAGDRLCLGHAAEQSGENQCAKRNTA